MQMRQVLLYQDDSYWVAEVPSLPGCITQGGSKEEAVRNVKEAIEGYIQALVADNLPVPPEKYAALTVVV